MAPTSSSSSATTIRDAFEKLEAAIHPSDVRLFKSTILEAVRDAAKVIERDQSQRRTLRSLRRIEPLFQALGKFGGAIDTLSQGTPYLCFIWAPIKLLLQIADEYTKGFEELVDAYGQIAQHLPRFDRYASLFDEHSDFQAILADVYSDILDFHRHAYKIVRRPGWKHLFDASWRDFRGRLNAILQNLSKSKDLLDREANSFDILEAKEFRRRIYERVEREESERRDWQLRDTIAWLDLKGHDREQEDLFERRAKAREAGTCEWILQRPVISYWLDEEDRRPFVWLRGKPGSGKTTLATYLKEHCPVSPGSTILYCLCSYGFGKAENNVCSLVLRSLIAQLGRKHVDLLPHMYNNFVKLGVVTSMPRIREVLSLFINSLETTYLILDGLDECEGAHQKQTLTELTSLIQSDTQTTSSSLKMKVLVCSRETKDITRRLSKVPQVALGREREYVSRDIAIFTQRSLSELNDRFSQDVVNELNREIVNKADGMFLWVRLVLNTLLEQESVRDLRAAARRLPTGLPGVYKTILDLFPYINDFWIQHLQTFCKSVSEGIKHDTSYQEIQVLLQKLSNSSLLVAADLCNASQLPSLDNDAPTNVQLLSATIRAIVTLGQDPVEKDRPLANQNEPLEFTEQPNGLSEAYRRFRDLLESILYNGGPFSHEEMHVSLEDLQHFRLRHGACSYLCHWTGCPWASIGFPSSNERSRHEEVHKHRFRCSDSECGLYFASRRALRAHELRYHTEPAEMVLPTFLLQSKRIQRPVASDGKPNAMNPMNRETQQDAFGPPKPKTPEDFIKGLQAFMAMLGRSVDVSPVIYGRPLQLLQLYAAVVKNGGSLRISSSQQWMLLAQQFGFPMPQQVQAGREMEAYWRSNLAPYEAAWERSLMKQRLAAQAAILNQQGESVPNNVSWNADHAIWMDRFDRQPQSEPTQQRGLHSLPQVAGYSVFPSSNDTHQGTEMDSLESPDSGRAKERSSTKPLEDGTVGGLRTESNLDKFNGLMPEIQQRVNEHTLFFPPALIEGTRQAEEWLREAKSRFGQAIQRLQVARTKKAEFQRQAHQRQALGHPLTPQEMGKFNEKLAMCNKAMTESKPSWKSSRHSRRIFKNEPNPIRMTYVRWELIRTSLRDH